MKAVPHNGSLRYRFEFRNGMLSRRCEFPCDLPAELDQRQFFCRYERISSMFSRSLSDELADLGDIAAAVYLADRLSPRRHPDASERSRPLHRIIEVEIETRVPDLWSGRPSDLLRDLLWFLGRDEWVLTFKPMSPGSRPPKQGYLFEFRPSCEPMVMLFSGGLDSFAGAVQQLENADRYHVLVSGSTNARMAAGQQLQARVLASGRNDRCQHVRIPYGLPVKPEGVRFESTQRTRGFIHLSLGTIAVLHLGARELFVYENGIGALNVPFDASQVGWEVSHPVHPGALLRMERLVEALGLGKFAIRTPFLFLTKAESLRQTRMNGFSECLRETFSCDRFPNHREGTRQCGICPSCVLRRLALERAGLAAFDPAGDYRHDVTAPSFVPKPGAAFVLDKFDAQTHRFRQCLDESDPWLAFSRLDPELGEAERALVAEGQDRAQVDKKLIRLFRSHAAEWENFSGRGALARYLGAATVTN